MKYVYSFFATTKVNNKDLQEFFSMLDCRIEIVKTEKDFQIFRKTLESYGISLIRIVRVLEQKWEQIT